MYVQLLDARRILFWHAEVSWSKTVQSSVRFSGTFSFATTFPQAPKSTFLVIYKAIQELLDMVLARSHCRCASQPNGSVSKRNLGHMWLQFLRPLDVDLVECHAPGEVIVWETQGSKIQGDCEGWICLGQGRFNGSRLLCLRLARGETMGTYPWCLCHSVSKLVIMLALVVSWFDRSTIFHVQVWI